MFYSAGAAGFYDDRVHTKIPADAVEITAAQHQRLFVDQTAGAVIQPDMDGRSPCARKPIVTLDTRRGVAIGEVKVEARRRILALATIEQQTNDNAIVARAALGSAGIGVKVDPVQLAQALARRAAIDAIRTASDVLEASIATMNTRALTALDVSANANWPA